MGDEPQVDVPLLLNHDVLEALVVVDKVEAWSGSDEACPQPTLPVPFGESLTHRKACAQMCGWLSPGNRECLAPGDLA